MIGWSLWRSMMQELAESKRLNNTTHVRTVVRGTNFWDLPLPNEIREYVPKLLALAFIIRNVA